MLDQLKHEVYRANLDLAAKGLVHETFGNVSGVDRTSGCLVIKPSGVPYDQLNPGNMVIVSLEDGKARQSDLRPSSDTPTHLRLYQAFSAVGGIAHTHSPWATAWSQARREIPVLGTTHADYFRGPIPCTRPLKTGEIESDYEANTAAVIVERFSAVSPIEMPAVLVAAHGPFTWGNSPAQAVANAVALEYAARLAAQTLRIDPKAVAISSRLLDKHFRRKHGPEAYYGQT